MSIIRRLEATNVEMKTIIHDPEAGGCKVTVMRPLINVPPRIFALVIIAQEVGE